MDNSNNKLDLTKPVTYKGYPARIIATDMKNETVALRGALIFTDNGRDTLSYFNPETGICQFSGKQVVVNVPVKTSTWQMVSSNNGWLFGCFSSKKDCDGFKPLAAKPIGYLRRDFIDGVFTGAEFEPI